MDDRKITVTKRQHYVPKAYLNFFANKESSSPKVYAYFCKDDVIKYVSIDSICCRNYLYEQKIEYPGEKKITLFAPNEIEKDFIDIEGYYVSICSSLIENIAAEKAIEVSNHEKECFVIYVVAFV